MPMSDYSWALYLTLPRAQRFIGKATFSDQKISDSDTNFYPAIIKADPKQPLKATENIHRELSKRSKYFLQWYH